MKREKGTYKKKDFRRGLMNLRSNYTEQISESNPCDDKNLELADCTCFV